MQTPASTGFEVSGDNDQALFTLKAHRGEGMVLLAMNWKVGQPPVDFVGFAIEYREPNATDFTPVRNRLNFLRPDGTVDPAQHPTAQSPIQMFRWVHFPRNAELDGKFRYSVKPVFMGADGTLTEGEPQQVDIALRRETYPGELNVAFTRGFVSSQAFVDHFGGPDVIKTLLPAKATEGLTFTPTHPQADEALSWMGFEARSAILELLDQAIGDPTAKVKAIAYDLNEPQVVGCLEKLGKRLKMLIDDSKDHGADGSAENQAEGMLVKSAGRDQVRRQHMGNLQHNKAIVVDGDAVQGVVCGSTNFSWRGLYVQSNNAVVLRGEKPVKLFSAAFDDFWDHSNDVDGFGHTAAAQLTPIGLDGIDASVAFSPHIASNALLQTIADDVTKNTKSSVLYSLAFLYQTEGAIRDAIKAVTEDSEIFVYGISDKKVGGLDLQKPDGNVAPVEPAALTKNVPEPFRSEPAAADGIRMHHKFVVIDFNQPTARVYLGSYNFSNPADLQNGENLLLIKDRRIATSYMVEALRIFDHYHFRVKQQEADTAKAKLALAKPPQSPTDTPWWDEYYTVPQKIRDREMFA
jgi:PLD-like domain